MMPALHRGNYWVAVKDFNVIYYIGESILTTMYIYIYIYVHTRSGNFI